MNRALFGVDTGSSIFDECSCHTCTESGEKGRQEEDDFARAAGFPRVPETMQRHLEDGSTSSHTASGASVEIDSGYADYISFGVVPLAMALGILTRTTLARWVP